MRLHDFNNLLCYINLQLSIRREMCMLIEYVVLVYYIIMQPCRYLETVVFNFTLECYAKTQRYRLHRNNIRYMYKCFIFTIIPRRFTVVNHVNHGWESLPKEYNISIRLSLVSTVIIHVRFNDDVSAVIQVIFIYIYIYIYRYTVHHISV